MEPPPEKKFEENKKDKDFTSRSKKKTFKQKKNQGKMMQANFYSLLEKPDLLEEEEDRLECIPTTKLDGKRRVIAMENTLE